MIAFLLGCAPPEVEQHRCLGPVVELVKWRNGQNQELAAGRATAEQVSIASEARLSETVSSLREQAWCDGYWRFGLWSTPDTPSAVLRDRALRQALELPSIAYPPPVKP